MTSQRIARRASILDVLTDSAREPSAIERISTWVRAGRLVAIRNAFWVDFAEVIHSTLETTDAWKLYENYSGEFQYRHHNLYRTADYPDALINCRELFDAPETKSWASSVTGRTCENTVFSASLYLPGDYSLPHDDCVQTPSGSRQVAFVWHLTKGWDVGWGGALYWCPAHRYIQPAFNTLYIFNVNPRSVHLVTQVNHEAKAKRLTINGWWLGPGTQSGESCSATTTLLGDSALQAY
jgi:hypothetical protein